MKYNRTLVTGGHGLIGSTIPSDFKPTSKELNLMRYEDILGYLTTNGIDSIIHCAAKVGGIGANMSRPGEFFYGNIIMNTNLLEAARVSGVKKVVSFMSTCVFPSNVAHPLSPRTNK
jgi:GDP-L-fucose synthase